MTLPVRLPPPPADSVYAVTWNPCRPGMVATGGGDDKAFLWQVRGVGGGLEGGEGSRGCLGSANCTQPPSLTPTTTPQVGSGEATFELTGHTDTVCSMGFAADGALLATGALDGARGVGEHDCARVCGGRRR